MMKLWFLSGVVSLGLSMWFYMYLWGLDTTNDAKYNEGFYGFCIILFFLAIYAFYKQHREDKKNIRE